MIEIWISPRKAPTHVTFVWDKDILVDSENSFLSQPIANFLCALKDFDTTSKDGCDEIVVSLFYYIRVGAFKIQCHEI